MYDAMYDAIVIGARCAGAPTAMLLARRGYRVLLVDRGRFPSEIPHGHFIHRHGPARLARWGLLDRVAATGCPPVTAVTRDDDDFPLVGRDMTADGIPLGYGPRRAVLDEILVDAAVEGGAELREGFAVEDLVTDGDRVVGVRGRARAGGAPCAERARVTIGADGRHSRVARLVRAPVYDAAPPAACWYFSYWSDAAVDGLEIHRRGESVVIAHPTTDGLSAVFVGVPMAALGAMRRDVARGVLAVVDRVPALAERLRAGRRADRFYGASDLPNFYRRPYGPGWALVGDAGCHKDPYLALGICDALRDAELLAEAIDDGLAGRRALDDALADYERRRNAASADDYRLNLRAARFEPVPPELRRLRAALRGNEGDTRQFLLACAGLIPREQFFDPANVARVLRCAVRAILESDNPAISDTRETGGQGSG
jgi:flavin-dependent dehydrogenase